jgi:hypothetical protein
MQAEDAWGVAIKALNDLGITTIIKAAMVWMKSHPWETAALIVPVLLTACTPAFLGLAGFTAGGVAAGLDSNIHPSRCITDIYIGSIAAGIQAGIGNVAAGSIFATLTSAAMSGYGVPIVFGGVWRISSVMCWGLAAWKKWRQDSNYADGVGRGDSHTNDEGTETAKSHPRSPEE